MEYSEVRPQIRSGDILAFTHRKWGSWRDIKVQLVRFFTQSEYSHLATAWVIGGRVFVIEAVTPLVRIYPLSKLGNFFWIPTGVTWKDKTEELALSYVGNKYSQIQAVQSFFEDPPEDDLWECAELVKALAKSDGLVLQSSPTPANLVRELQALGKSLNFVHNGGDHV